MILYLYQHNNYYNRIVKKFDTIEEYGIPLAVFSGINFIANNGIQTSQIVNYEGNMPDYVIVADESNSIISRWFVLQSNKIRGGQYELSLYRDVIVDWYDEIVEAPCFIDKAILPQADPRIFNSEDMSFNQIKTSETLLMDETKSAWLVGYCSRKEVNEPLTSQQAIVAPTDIALTRIEDYELFKHSNLAADPVPLNAAPSTVIYNVYRKYRFADGSTYLGKISFNKEGPQKVGTYLGTDSVISNQIGSAIAGIKYNYIYENISAPTAIKPGTTWPLGAAYTGYEDNTSHNLRKPEYFVKGFEPYYDAMEKQIGDFINVAPEEDTVRYLNENNKTIYVSSENAYYQVSVERKPAGEAEISVPAGGMYNLFIQGMNQTAVEYYNDTGSDLFYRRYYPGSPTPNGSFSIRTIGEKFEVVITKLPTYGTTYTTDIPANRYALGDAPYDMFCMPFSDDLDIYQNGVFKFKSSKIHAWNAFMSLTTKYSGSNTIYDVQLLPYCPVRYCISGTGQIDIGDHLVGHVRIQGAGDPVAYILFGVKSSDSFAIPCSIPVEDKKLQGQTDLWRLVSPNYSGQFEFNVAKNDGVDYVEVDYTYKPFTPYIHVAPNFKGLYGSDFNDARGLICGGDYSIPAASNQWDTYELQNKNYQLAFDRQIQNMEVNNSVQKEMEKVQAIVGVVQGAATGAMAGGQLGSAGGGIGRTIGAAAGMAAGVAISTIAAKKDMELNQLLRNEALDYTKDQFGFQMQNIQALPNTLNKVSAFNANNKVFPFLEYYTCTDMEKAALIDKIRYNGMTVGSIGKLSDFIGNTYRNFDRSYIKGKIIRLDALSGDSFIANTIANEVNKGVFV